MHISSLPSSSSHGIFHADILFEAGTHNYRQNIKKKTVNPCSKNVAEFILKN
jgi:hypothetical protein